MLLCVDDVVLDDDGTGVGVRFLWVCRALSVHFMAGRQSR
jgi:hypothetical protein